MFKSKNSEQEAYLKSGRIIVDLAITLAVKADDPDQAKLIAEKWMQTIHAGRLNEANRLRKDACTPVHWVSSRDYIVE